LKEVLTEEMTSNTVIHTRNTILVPFIRKALPFHYRNAYILAEFRGLIIDELKVAHPKRFIDYLTAYCIKVPYARILLNKLYKDENSFITAVSPLFKQLILQKNVSIKRVSVHPNIVSPDFVFSPEHRKGIRKKYGLSDNQPIAVMSSGGGTIWQKDQDVLEKLLQDGIIVFNLGKNAIKREGVINGYLPRDEMPKYLSAADVAVLWRDNIPLNNLACPSKFGEFVIMGLYVIHNGTVDIAKRYIEDNDAGIIVNTPEDIKIDMSKLDIETRKRRCVAGFNMFSVERIAKSYISHYINKN
jgi:hypothetical protein